MLNPLYKMFHYFQIENSQLMHAEVLGSVSVLALRRRLCFANVCLSAKLLNKRTQRAQTQGRGLLKLGDNCPSST